VPGPGRAEEVPFFEVKIGESSKLVVPRNVEDERVTRLTVSLIVNVADLVSVSVDCVSPVHDGVADTVEFPVVTTEVSVPLLELTGKPLEPVGYSVVSIVFVVETVVIAVTLTVEIFVIDPGESVPEDEVDPEMIVIVIEPIPEPPVPDEEDVVLAEEGGVYPVPVNVGAVIPKVIVVVVTVIEELLSEVDADPDGTELEPGETGGLEAVTPSASDEDESSVEYGPEPVLARWGYPVG
jgi:hypothetical protein